MFLNKISHKIIDKKLLNDLNNKIDIFDNKCCFCYQSNDSNKEQLKINFARQLRSLIDRPEHSPFVETSRFKERN